MRECPDPLQFALLIAQRLDPDHAIGLEEHWEPFSARSDRMEAPWVAGEQILGLIS